LDERILNGLHEYGQKAFRMTIIANHDENAWQGTVFERYREGRQTKAITGSSTS